MAERFKALYLKYGERSQLLMLRRFESDSFLHTGKRPGASPWGGFVFYRRQCRPQSIHYMWGLVFCQRLIGSGQTRSIIMRFILALLCISCAGLAAETTSGVRLEDLAKQWQTEDRARAAILVKYYSQIPNDAPEPVEGTDLKQSETKRNTDILAYKNALVNMAPDRQRARRSWGDMMGQLRELEMMRAALGMAPLPAVVDPALAKAAPEAK